MRLTLLVFSILAALTHSAYCADWLPEKKLFLPFTADLTQPAFGARLTGIVGGRNRAEVNLGDEFGIVSFPFNNNSVLRFGIMGGAGARFDISKITNDFEVADFSLAFPFDYAAGDWALRAMYWHTSSHIGDDYIRTNSIAPGDLQKHVTDEVRWYAGYTGIKHLRFYGGMSYAFNLIPDSSKRNRVHAGIEGSIARESKSLFAAADLQSLQRLGWQPSFTARAGGKLTGKASAVSCFLEFFSGHLTYLSFMEQKETHWSFGFTFEM